MSKNLVAYFSASGITKALSERLAEAVSGDLYEIRPQTPYTNDDLNWLDKKSRSSVEMADKSCRPPIADNNANVAGADIVYIGFPVWWYREPSIIDTFLEAYDFTGKTIIILGFIVILILLYNYLRRLNKFKIKNNSRLKKYEEFFGVELDDSNAFASNKNN